MTKNPELETKYERFLRIRAEKVCQAYLNWSSEILSGSLKPNRIIQRIAEDYGMSGQGVRSILERRGIYESAANPVVVPVAR